MRNFLIIIAIFAITLSCKVNAQKTNLSSDKVISVHLSQDTDTDKLQIKYFIIGSFGGVGSFVRIKPNVWNYEISTSYEGKPVEKLRLVVFSPNYQVKTFDFPILEKQNEVIEVKLEFIRTLPFFGRVLLPIQSDAEEMQLKISYTSSWECEYFQLPDCLLGAMPITSVNLEKDGRFKANLPDFARDSLIASYEQKGSFAFTVEDKSGKLLFRLKPKENLKGFNEIQTALSYPVEQVFVPNPKE